MNIKKWAAANGFNYSTVQAVIRSQRGKWHAGKCRKIVEALVNQGLMTQAEAVARGSKDHGAVNPPTSTRA